MKKIVVTSDKGFSKDQKNRLKKFGEVTFHIDSPNTPGEWLSRVQGAEIIISSRFGLKDNLYNLRDVFVSYPFVSLGNINKEKLKLNKVILANAPGSNKNAVCEWITVMMLNLTRKFHDYLSNKKEMPLVSSGLKNKKVTILGRGNIGAKMGLICKAFDMRVNYFSRGDDLIAKSGKADIIINCLSHNESTANLLDETFFKSLQPGIFFITCVSQKICDSDAMIKVLDKGILAGVADDCASGNVGDTNYEYYKKISEHPKILATPHIAWASEASIADGNEMSIKNVEAWAKGKPINIAS
ncbi:MAG: NAD(P)-dependent oxidoreductase [Parcubacteria group bacterium]|jgi:phosphoglycerate dehydrogenase-like enzyme